MFIQWALSAFPDVTPSHNGNAAAEEGRSQAPSSISVQPAAGSVAADDSMLVLICYIRVQKQPVRVDPNDKAVVTDQLRPAQSTETCTPTLLNLLWDKDKCEQLDNSGGSDVSEDAETILFWAFSPRSSRKTFQGQMSDIISSPPHTLGLPWDLLKASRASLLFTSSIDFFKSLLVSGKKLDVVCCQSHKWSLS